MTIFVFTDEQQDLRDMVRRFLAEKSPVSEVRRLMATEAGYDPAVWAQLGRLGLAGLTIPEKYGGAGRGPVEQLIVCEEMGAVLLCAPYLASAVLAAWALLASGDPAAQADLLPGIASGETIATLAVPEDDGSWEPDELMVTARRSGDRYLLDGRKSFVLDGMIANLILVAASSDDGPALLAVDGDAPGLSRQAMQTLDMTRKQAVLTFSAAPGRPVGQPGAAAEIVTRAVRGGVLALAAEQVGGAQRCLDMAVAYAKVRHQFGRPIGSFQAIKHMCADMLLEVESARSAAYRAAWTAADRDADLPLVASLAKAFCSEAYFHVAAANIQVHGGIGFTWEHDAHLYYRRAKSAEVMLGMPASHREIAAGLLLKDSADPPGQRRNHLSAAPSRSRPLGALAREIPELSDADRPRAGKAPGMDTMTDDVVVVGGRCAGAPTAMLLARAELSVRLLERSAHLGDMVSGHLIKPAGVARLRRWKVLDAVLATGCPRLDDRVLWLGGQPHRPPAPEPGTGPIAPRRTVLDPILLTAAAQAGAEVEMGVSVHGLLREGGRVTGVRTSAGQRRARLVIGADGRNSRVARLVGATIYHDHPPVTFAYYTYWRGCPVAGLHAWLEPGRFFGVFPVGAGLALAFVQGPRGQYPDFRRDPLRAYLSELRSRPALAGLLGEAVIAERLRGTAALPTFFRMSSGPGWALVGDAGHHKDPVIARGIADAFRDADLVASAVVDGWHGDLEAALAEYGRQRDRCAIPLSDANLGIARLDLATGALGAAWFQMNELEQALDDPAAIGG